MDDPVLQLDQLALETKEFAEVLLTVDVVRDQRRTLARVGREPLVVDLHFELFVEAILVEEVVDRRFIRHLVIGHRQGSTPALGRAHSCARYA